jgi:hypothetical protein
MAISDFASKAQACFFNLAGILAFPPACRTGTFLPRTAWKCSNRAIERQTRETSV